MDSMILHLMLGSMIFWNCFFSCDRSLKAIISRYAIYPVILCFYAGTVLIYYSYPWIQELPFVSYCFAGILIILLPLLYKERISAVFYVFFSALASMLALLSICDLLIQYGPQLYPDFAFDDYQLQIYAALLLLYLTAVFAVLGKRHKVFLRCADKSLSILWLYPLLCFGLLLYMNHMEALTTDAFALLLLLTALLILFSFSMLDAAVSKSRVPAQLPAAPAVSFASSPALNEIKNDLRNKVEAEELLASQRELFDEIIHHYDTLLERTQLLDRHLQILNQLLLEENIKAANIYLDTIARSFHDVDRIAVCEYPLINTMLSYYHFQCIRHQIPFDINLNLPSYIGIKESDLCILLGCMLMNAIEACDYVPAEKERFIHLDVRTRNQELQIICDNTYDGFVNVVEQSFKSRKKKKGKGLRVMQKITAQYHGRIEAEYPQKVFSLYINLPLFDHRPALVK